MLVGSILVRDGRSCPHPAQCRARRGGFAADGAVGHFRSAVCAVYRSEHDGHESDVSSGAGDLATFSGDEYNRGGDSHRHDNDATFIGRSGDPCPVAGGGGGGADDRYEDDAAVVGW